MNISGGNDTASPTSRNATGGRRESYISTQLTSINTKLQVLFDELGLESKEREARERNVYAVISEALESHVHQVTQERDELYNKCVDTQSTLQEMLGALKDLDVTLILTNAEVCYQQVQPPYQQCCSQLDRAYEQVESIYSERLVRVNQTFEQLRDLSARVDGFSVRDELMLHDDDLDLSNTHILNLEAEVGRWQEELSRRISAVASYAASIVSLWAELGTPQADIDRNILNSYRSNPERLGTLQNDMDSIKSLYEGLEAEKQTRADRIDALRQQIEHLWSKLSEPEEETKLFDRSNRGLATTVIDAHEKELERLNEKKRQHIHVFIQDARSTLHELWNKLYFSEDETLEFTPAWTEVYTDASLDAHESEIARLEKLAEERKPILSLIEEFYSLQRDSEALQASSQDSSRLLSKGPGRRDPGRLLKEEQMRKRIAKKQPRVLQELRAALEAWIEKHNKQFFVNGQDFSIELRELEAKRGMGRGRKAQPGNTSSPTKSMSPVKKAPFQQQQTAQARSQSPVKRAPSQKKGVPSRMARPASPTKSTTSTNSTDSASTFKRPLMNPHPAMRIPSAPMAKSTTPGGQHRRNISQPQNSTPRPNSRLNAQSTNTLNKQKSFSNLTTFTKSNDTNTQMTINKPTIALAQSGNTSIPSVTGSTTSSENWEAYDDDSSDDEMMLNGDYMKWREENMRKLASGENSQQEVDPHPSRVSEFNWDKDVF